MLEQRAPVLCARIASLETVTGEWERPTSPTISRATNPCTSFKSRKEILCKGTHSRHRKAPMRGVIDDYRQNQNHICGRGRSRRSLPNRISEAGAARVTQRGQYGKPGEIVYDGGRALHGRAGVPCACKICACTTLKN
ncbi:hypothetical protein EVAR_10829_1 [Eumeta japonica]|uniref:Uncharacterized protein n=1 Tax=Eumeta variegata TaxID=151549 RepID=A0A4C1YAX6_EUMVA|nr:hypothetical protein EVAR_10829_1 [Eumeta japonica]